MPWPTPTAAATQTPQPTYTPYPTAVPAPAAEAILPYLDDLLWTRTLLLWSTLLLLALGGLSLAVLALAWRGRPLPIVVHPALPIEGIRLSDTAVQLPPPDWPPVREPVTEPVTPPVTPVLTGDDDTITVRVKPTDPNVEEGVAREICEIWNRLERPSLTAVCFEYFGGKNAERFAIVRAAVAWGRAQGLIRDGGAS